MLALQSQLEEAYRRTYGGGSERRPKTEDEPEPEKKAQSGHGPTPQPELPIEEVELEVDEADRACPTCGLEMADWDGHHDESEEIDVVQLQYVLTKVKRKKCKCSACGHIETAIGLAKVVPGGRYSLDFAVHVAIEKYADHLPLDRQVRRMKRAGLITTTQTLWDQILSLSHCFSDALERLHAHLLTRDVVLVDETRWPLLGVKGRKTKNWFVWSLVADHGVIYRIQDSRSNEAGKALLRDFSGVAVADGYVVYESLARQNGFTLANDWCHVRRKLIEAEGSSPEIAGELLDEIGALFKIEREVDERVEGLAAEDARRLREQVRDEQSREVLNRIGAIAGSVKALRESPIAKAVQYLDNRWEGLNAFLADGRVPITSNGVERALRGPVLGRVNHYGSKSQRGTEVAAVFYTLIESANANGVEPAAYLRAGALAYGRGETVPLPHEIA
ncbi:MAG: IS66 family transposase [Deltaproteobacteria bacterium]